MSSKKKLNSNLIAAIVTFVIHATLITALSVDFGAMSSAKPGSEDEELLLDLEELVTEDIEIAPPGKDPLSENTDKSSESISDNNGPVKTTTNQPEPMEEMVEKLPVPDSMEIKKEIVQQIKTDTTPKLVVDSTIAALIQQTNTVLKKNNKRTNNMSQKERYEFYKKNYRLIRNFQKVYPYALKTREIIENLNAELATMSSEPDKKRLIKETEQMLFREYESAVRTMSTSQGKLLLKLIARETNKTGYEIIKEYKGAFSATFWYGVGKIFNTDLKAGYDREQKEDSLIEDVLDKYKKNELY
mgnify:CR=1 FL=1